MLPIDIGHDHSDIGNENNEIGHEHSNIGHEHKANETDYDKSNSHLNEQRSGSSNNSINIDGLPTKLESSNYNEGDIVQFPKNSIDEINNHWESSNYSKLIGEIKSVDHNNPNNYIIKITDGKIFDHSNSVSINPNTSQLKVSVPKKYIEGKFN